MGRVRLDGVSWALLRSGRNERRTRVHWSKSARQGHQSHCQSQLSIAHFPLTSSRRCCPTPQRCPSSAQHLPPTSSLTRHVLASPLPSLCQLPSLDLLFPDLSAPSTGPFVPPLSHSFPCLCSVILSEPSWIPLPPLPLTLLPLSPLVPSPPLSSAVAHPPSLPPTWTRRRLTSKLLSFPPPPLSPPSHPSTPYLPSAPANSPPPPPSNAPPPSLTSGTPSLSHSDGGLRDGTPPLMTRGWRRSTGPLPHPTWGWRRRRRKRRWWRRALAPPRHPLSQRRRPP